MFLLKLPLKLIALPLVAALALIQWAAVLIASVSGGIVNILLGIVSMIVLSSWALGLGGNLTCGLTLCAVLFILPQIAKWCVVRLAGLQFILKEFVRS